MNIYIHPYIHIYICTHVDHISFRFRFRPSESADEDYDPIRTWGIKNTRSSRFVTVQLGQTR